MSKVRFPWQLTHAQKQVFKIHSSVATNRVFPVFFFFSFIGKGRVKLSHSSFLFRLWLDTWRAVESCVRSMQQGWEVWGGSGSKTFNFCIFFSLLWHGLSATPLFKLNSCLEILLQHVFSEHPYMWWIQSTQCQQQSFSFHLQQHQSGMWGM